MEITETDAAILEALGQDVWEDDELSAILNTLVRHLGECCEIEHAVLSFADDGQLPQHALHGISNLAEGSICDVAEVVVNTAAPQLLEASGSVCFVVPLIWRGSTVGALALESRDRDAFAPDRQPLFLRAARLVAGPVMMARRIAEEVRLRRELAHATARLEAMVEHAPLGITFFDASHRLVLANQAALEMLGIATDDVADRAIPWNDLVERFFQTRWLGDPQELWDVVAATREMRSGTLVTDFPLQSPNQMLLRLAAPVLEDGVFSGHVVLFTDVTQERRAVAMAEAAVASRDRFISIASHELKTPLTSIKGMAQLLQRAQASGRLTPERLEARLATIETQAERLQILIDELLDISRVQFDQLVLYREETDVGSILDDLVATMPTSQRQRLEIARDEVVAGWWDPVRLEQVVQNLLDNALKYSAPTDPVTVTMRSDGHWALIEVADHGIGIPADELAALFEPFSRATNAGRLDANGLGLGLFICRQIIERHDGTITVSSVEGEGSTFTLRLPTYLDPASRPADAS